MEQLGKNGVRFNAGIDPKKEIFNLYAKESIPRNFLIDQDGKIVFISIGYTEENLTVIADKIDEIIKK